MKTKLPDDIEQLKVMLLQQKTQLRTYAGQVDGSEREIERLKAQLDKLRRMLFGQSSEKKAASWRKKIHEAEKRLAEMETRLGLGAAKLMPGIRCCSCCGI